MCNMQYNTHTHTCMLMFEIITADPPTQPPIAVIDITTSPKCDLAAICRALHSPIFTCELRCCAVASMYTYVCMCMIFSSCSPLCVRRLFACCAANGGSKWQCCTNSNAISFKFFKSSHTHTP